MCVYCTIHKMGMSERYLKYIEILIKIKRIQVGVFDIEYQCYTSIFTTTRCMIYLKVTYRSIC